MSATTTSLKLHCKYRVAVDDLEMKTFASCAVLCFELMER